MKIAVAVDGSKHAIRALEKAVQLAEMVKDSQLIILHVDHIEAVKNAQFSTGGAHSFILKQAELVKSIREKMETSKVIWHLELLKGEPSEKIIRFVNNEQMDHLFIGSRGLNSLQQFMLGSVSHRVTKYVKCPVTVVK